MEVLKSVAQFVIIAFIAFLFLLVKESNNKGYIDRDDIVYGGIASLLVAAFVNITFWAFT